MAKENSRQTVNADPYATVADFKRIFTKDVNSLYLLSLLLTADSEKAERCFIDGIGESARGTRVFKEWARSWARRSIIQNAIRLIKPQQSSMTTIQTGNSAGVMDKVPIVLRAEVCAILELPPFERFVFVMSVLERYSDHNCTILLGCPRRNVAPTRIRAMQRLVTLLGLENNGHIDTEGETVIELIIAQLFATPAWTQSLSR